MLRDMIPLKQIDANNQKLLVKIIKYCFKKKKLIVKFFFFFPLKLGSVLLLEVLHSFSYNTWTQPVKEAFAIFSVGAN